MTPEIFRKRPVEVEAVRVPLATLDPWDLEEVDEFITTFHEIANWCKGTPRFMSGPPHILIDTKEGVMTAQMGDWIIREPFPTSDRQFYPCKPDIFEQTYERPEPD